MRKSASSSRWRVRSHLRPEIERDKDGEPFRTGASEFVTVVFDDPYEYEVVTDDKGRIVSLAVRGPEIDQATLRSITVNYLAEAARSQRLKVDEAYEEGFTLTGAFLEAVSEDFRPSQPETPTPEEFASRWNAIGRAVWVDGVRVPRRELLAKHYGVSVYAIDKWSRKARDRGLIDEVNRERTRTETRGDPDPGHNNQHDIQDQAGS